jgi:tetratricopeptide (TPR) repeat protein/SAM-dependent methyltransferase
MNPGRNDPCSCGSGRKYKHCCGRADSGAPARDEAGAYNAQAALLQRQGRYDEAVASYRKALAISPDVAELHFNLGTALHDQGRVDDAIACYRRALELKPGLVVAYNNLGNALAVCGKPDEAAASYARALAIAPSHVEARRNLAAIHYNAANALRDRGDAHAALERYREALALRPDFAEAQANLAGLLHAHGRLDDALGCYRAAVVMHPDDPRLHNNLGNVHDELGDVAGALASYRRALELADTPEIRPNFARCLSRASTLDAPSRALLVRALREAWARPADLAPVAIKTIDSDSDALFADPLLLALLESAAVCDADLERRLTTARRGLLDTARRADLAGHTDLTFACALAHQCFINEHVYATSDDELAAAHALRESLVAALASGEGVSTVHLLAVACYSRLADLPGAEACLTRAWPDAVRQVLVEQIEEPLVERRDAPLVPSLTSVADGVSLQVQRQYEENPYPRWMRSATVVPVPSINAMLRRQFPFARFDPLRNDTAMEMLVAGCGTGQEAIEAAQLFPDARVLGIDLSRASLAYARRKSRAAGVTNVEYGQADVLQAATLGRTFDVVSSVGVLHHLAEPAEGLRALLSVLRRGGLMRIGLYSERARRDVVAAREFIAAGGYGSDIDGIRHARAAIVAERARFEPLLGRRGFYTASECRDLLFHAQEHRFTLPRIAGLLAEHGLRFIGFLLEPHVAHRYTQRFSDDASRTDLAHWQAFETEFPDTFAGMYRFWVQRPA